MVLYDLTLFIYWKNGYITGNPRKLAINVSSDEPYDKLSKRINRYRHTIQYSESIYNSSNYNISVYDKYAFFYRYILKFHCPKIKVVSVDLFFKSSDRSNTHPLVIGINQQDKDPVYYTYAFLIGHTAPKLYYNADYTDLPDSDKSFKSEDLLTRLIEEHDLTSNKGGNKIVVRLDSKPNVNSETDDNTPYKYPKTGTNREKISLSKSEESLHGHFVKYEHKIYPKFNVPEFYLSYFNDTVLLENYIKFKSLTCVDVYYNKHYENTPVMMVLNSETEKKMYLYSDLKNDLQNSNQTKKIYKLKNIGDGEIYHILKEENDKLNKNLFYLIDLKSEYSYRVKVSNQNNDSLNGFKKYTHVPCIDYKDRQSDVLCNGKKLMQKTKETNKIEEIKELQGQKFSFVEVYFGTKNDSIPLIIKLSKSNNKCEYYAHNKDDGSYWEKISNSNLNQSNNQNLVKKLKEIQSNLFDSVCIVVDRQTKYTKNDIEGKTMSKLSDSQPDEINVNANDSIECLKGTNFKCYEHTLTSSSVPTAESSSSDNVKLRLFLSTSNEKCSEITLYGGENESDLNKEYLYYEKKPVNNGNGKFSVIFYCEKDKNSDNRPLLLCYQKKVYMPSSIENYNSKWVHVKDVEFISSNSGNTKLLDTLMRIIYLLNPVNIDKFNDRNNYATEKYSTQVFNVTSIQITIQAKDLNCYRKYTHTASKGYILGEITHSGNKLFESYENYKSSLLSGYTNKFPVSVDVYFYLYDNGHNYPLLVVLKFSNSYSVYYKLVKKERPLKWELISDSYESGLVKNKIEDLLYNIRYHLGIEYERKKENLITASADKCNEGNKIGLIAGVVSTLTVLAGGAAGFVYKYPQLVGSIYRRINN